MNDTELNSHTPMIRQYLEIKKDYPNTLLFYRMGDFYEMFFEDAELGSRALGITLTKRGNSAGSEIKMAGVPFHSSEQYLARLIKQGISVAIVEQVAESKNNKGPMERKITRIVTPGTLSEEGLLEEKQNNFLLSIFIKDNQAAIAWTALTSNKLSSLEVNQSDLINQIKRLRPGEIIAPSTLALKLKKELTNYSITPQENWNFDYKLNYEKLKNHFNTHDLSGYGVENKPLSIASLGALLDYLQHTQKAELKHINQIQVENTNQFLAMDSGTRANLELSLSLKNEKTPSLLSTIDYCNTAMGSRLLDIWLNNPLTNINEIKLRHSAVAELIPYNSTISQVLKKINDIERLSGRIGLKTAKPRDLIGLKTSLSELKELNTLNSFPSNSLITKINTSITNFPAKVLEYLTQAICDNPNLNIRDGGVIKTGFNQELDYLRDIASNANQFLINLEQKERERTGINNLKVEYNKVHGYYIEITKTWQDKVPLDYRRTQTLKNAERYTTLELKNFENQVLRAYDNALTLEKSLYNEVLEFLNQYLNLLQDLAFNIAMLDVFNNFAFISQKNNWICPDLTTGQTLEIKGSRHPTIETQVEYFTPNDISLSPTQNFILITGPNMGGKSTYMRQVATTLILAYIGCFVPAEKATIGEFDRIFTRIGASDDLAAGKSTFMVEMSETANILNNATAKSLIIIDEIGRGTSTYDGLALAYAILCYLIEKVQACTLFATHYFELTKLETEYPTLINKHLTIHEEHGEMVFLHKLATGPATKSYGIQVAKLAGIPNKVLDKAFTYLAHLESANNHHNYDLFSYSNIVTNLSYQEISPLEPEIPSYLEEIARQLNTTNPDKLTPLEALNLIYQLTKLLPK